MPWVHPSPDARRRDIRLDTPRGHAENDDRRRNRRNQDITGVWLDSNIDKSQEWCRDTITKLRSIVNTMETFTDYNQCMWFLQQNMDKRIFLITSGSLSARVVPNIHHIPQVDVIFIFCRNRNRYEDWAENWLKIYGVFTEIIDLCEAMKELAQHRDQDTLPLRRTRRS